MLLNFRSYTLLITACLIWTGCHVGGRPTSSLEAPKPVITTEIPTIAVPSESTHYSNQNTLEISGLCNTGFIVYLMGSEFDSQVCSNSQYQFFITRTTDGIYPFMVTQAEGGKQASQPAVLFWVRKASITAPSITSPATNPFQSGLSVLTLAGGCETGAIVSLEGDAVSDMECVNSQYSFNITKLVDQAYNITVRQTDQAGNTATTNFTWNRIAMTVSPSNPQIVVDSEIIFDIQGGSGSYTGTLTANNSGATYTDLTKTYRAGLVAGVSDTLTISDTLGTTLVVSISTLPSTPDHFIIPADSGNGQTSPIGQNLTDPLKVIVNDKYGNAISNLPIVFSILNDGAQITGSSLVTTDSSGVASVTVSLNENATKVIALAKPQVGLFPDEAGTGNATVTFEIYPQFLNNAKFGTNFTTGNNPMQVASVDVDSDGFKDLVVLNSGEPSLGVLLGKGNGLFQNMTRITPICSGPTGFVANDFNSDTHIDFVISCSGSNRIAVILSNPDGTRLPATYIDVDMSETLPVAILSADFNKDGHLDIVTLSASGNLASLRLGSATGTFSAPTTYNVGAGPSALTTLDLNKDTFPDLAVVNSADNTISILVNNTAGGFLAQQTHPTGTAPVAIVAGDFNSDTFDDIVVINNGDGDYYVYLNDQFDNFHPPNPFVTTPSPLAITKTDLNGDGDLDVLITGSQDNELSVLLGRGDGNFDTSPGIPVGPNPIHLTTSDLNGDTNQDVILVSNGNQRLEILVGQGNGNVDFKKTVGAIPDDIAIVDIDSDNIKDLVVIERGANTIRLLKGNNTGLWSDIGTLATNNGPVSVVTKDLNNDGDIDIAVSHQNVPVVRVFIGDGTGNFAAGVDYSTALQPLSLISADIDGDGYLDLISANSGSSSISILKNAGNGTFQPRVDHSVGSQPTSVVVADLNNDSQLDIITANYGSSDISVLISNGASLSFQASAQFAAGSGANSLVAGFFNGDTFVDIAVANELAGTVSILRGIGDGSFHPATDFSSSNTPTSLKMGDFNGDGRQDLVVANGANNSFTILYGSGNGLFNLTEVFYETGSINTLQVGDLNSDTRADIITINPVLNSFNVWLGQ